MLTQARLTYNGFTIAGLLRLIIESLTGAGIRLDEHSLWIDFWPAEKIILL